jgi:hypothetical protein
MAKQGIDIIKSLRQKWIGYQLLADALLALAIALTAMQCLVFGQTRSPLCFCRSLGG